MGLSLMLSFIVLTFLFNCSGLRLTVYKKECSARKNKQITNEFDLFKRSLSKLVKYLSSSNFLFVLVLFIVSSIELFFIVQYAVIGLFQHHNVRKYVHI